jgi:hypothetical protein
MNPKERKKASELGAGDGAGVGVLGRLKSRLSWGKTPEQEHWDPAWAHGHDEYHDYHDSHWQADWRPPPGPPPPLSIYVIAMVFCSNFHFSVSLCPFFSIFFSNQIAIQTSILNLLFEQDSYSHEYLLSTKYFDVF